MKMMIVCSLMLFLFFDLFAVIPQHSAEYYEALTPEVQKAQRKGAKAKVIYRIVDDEGVPITGKQVRYRWQNDYPRMTWGGLAMTDTNGVVVLQEKVGARLAISVILDGYYASSDKICFCWRKGVSPLVKDGKWQPYGEKRTLVVKRWKKPVEKSTILPGYSSIPAPVTNQWVALDFEKMQWCYPYGNGKCPDALFRFGGVRKDSRNFNITLEVSFTNNPFAGYYIAKKDLYSEMKCDYFAPTNHLDYMARELKYEYVTAEGVVIKSECLNKDEYIVFRTRTRVDEDGNLVSANYGKISGEFCSGLAGIHFVDGVFFNLTPNDANLEDKDTYRRSVIFR